MNGKIAALALAAMLIMMARPTNAADTSQTAMVLLSRCTVAIRVDADFDAASEQAAIEGIRCLDYIRGFVDGLNFAAIAGKHERAICVPDNAQIVQLARVFVKFAEQNPEILHEGAAAVVGVAMQLSFPCRPGINRQ